jgi:CheY-like chemotaxis protein
MNLEPLDILLVEDSEDDIVLIRETLLGGKLINVIHVARDGEQALAYLRKEGPYANAKRPGLILMDINMPKKNGFETLDEIRHDPTLASLPVVMLTMSDREEDIVRAYTAGACSYVRKPLEFIKFQSVVEQFAVYWAIVATVPDEHRREQE